MVASGSNDKILIRERAGVPQAYAAYEQTHVNLADERLGAKVVAASDEWYAPAQRLLDPAQPNYYYHDDEGMRYVDGWETSRRRAAGHEWCVIGLGRPGELAAVGIDTRFFTGNYPLAVSIEGCALDGGAPLEEAVWRPLLPITPAAGDTPALHPLERTGRITHIRLNMHPDGGMARLRVFGKIDGDGTLAQGELADLAALENGACVLGCSDSHFGSVNALIAPGPSVAWGKGWESRRKRTPGHDWAVIALATPGRIEQALVDTKYYTGNFPAGFSLQGACAADVPPALILNEAMHWPELLDRQALQGGSEHLVPLPAHAQRIVTHVRLNIYPDGGVTRLRLFGRPARGA
ncbi:allantoicase [Bordetella genomosp. 10]|uniref:Probable allantoicase n=1 Tax=Bordetella genomosp. 10 TaxID=1416804 RepID=A0A261SA85_9BORD|nr:allantoicase [Bordetella genomosp. 10]OZI34266.1 allantoicase [Bordetella genomosp. 10]